MNAEPRREAPVGPAGTPDGAPEPAEVDHRVDFEELGCGDLAIALMKLMRRVDPGEVVELRAADPGAPADIPSWCAMTGHPFLAGPCGEAGDLYYLAKKREE